jgi:ABC-type multidrug transport system ATPase subunit
VKNNRNTASITQKELKWIIDELNKNDKVTVSITTHYHPDAKPIDGMI